ncbi:DUF805 domain-containing protein [Rhodoblastus sp.]|uniref:DUF805 domain-containing protein n=1 Tax=Rhodoblastus sp. TaxID=1962975 RepID=UPI00263041A5|nr:DUF805 domain-containing protein [Rhodoblastus sp.]
MKLRFKHAANAIVLMLSFSAPAMAQRGIAYEKPILSAGEGVGSLDSVLVGYLASYIVAMVIGAICIAWVNSIPLHELLQQFKLSPAMFRGRIDRARWWAYMAINYAVILIIYFFVRVAMHYIIPSHMALWSLIIDLLFILPLLSQVSIVIKRLHDRDRSGWLVMFWVAWWFLFPLSAEWPDLAWIFVASLVPWAWVLIEIGFLSGSQGENRYGPPCFNVA